jgi:hypothetical protein
MKLLFCKGCQDIVRPLIGIERKCQCGLCSIHGLHDGVTVQYSGEKAILFGIKNSSFIQAIHNQPSEGMGMDFTAFVLPKNCQSVIKK